MQNYKKLIEIYLINIFYEKPLQFKYSSLFLMKHFYLNLLNQYTLKRNGSIKKQS